MMLARLRTLAARLRALARLPRAERDLEDELRAYVDDLTAGYERRGLAPADARRAALIESGGVEQTRETVRDIRVGSALAAAWRDVRYGVRVLRRSPAFAFVVILTMALGIGVNVAVFSVIRAVLWKPLPYPNPAGLLAIEADTRGVPSAYAASGELFDPRAQSRLLTSIAQIEGRDASIAVDGVMERVAGARATDDLLPLLGAEPLAFGRILRAAQDADGILVKGVVISDELWRRRFGSDPQVVGRRFTVNNFDVQIVGVTRPGLRIYLPAANHVEEVVDVWLPTEYVPSRLHRGSTIIGRLAPGATIAQAQAECDALAASFFALKPRTAGNVPPRMSIRPLSDVIAREARPALLALGAAVGFVLLIACVNVANLMVVRAKARERELAVRRALGATRMRVVRQLLTESLVIAAIAGACGLALGRAGIDVLDWLRPVRLPRQSDIAIDAAAVLWTAGLSVASAVFFGLLPAIGSSRRAAGSLQSGRAGSLMLGSRRFHRGLVIAEIALSIVPLVAAGLLLRTFANLLQAPIGFDPANVVTARISLDLNAFNTVERRSTFYRDAIERVRALPGVDSASIGGPLPFAPVQTTQRYRRTDDVDAASSIALQQSVMPAYLGVMGIPIRAGRDISGDDIGQQRRVVIVDERLAAQLWHGDAVGKKLRIGERQVLDVIGVAGPIRAREVRDQETPMIYVPSHVYEIEQTLVAKTRVPFATIAPAIKQTVEALGPGRPVFDIRPMTEVMASSIDDTRFTMLVLSGFAAASMLLAGIGLYGTLSYLLAQRAQEFGVRVALGASAAGILRLVVREAALLTGLGAALGLAGAAVVMQSIRTLLYGVTPLDAATIGGAITLLAVVSVLAMIRPAWRASRIDPVRVLRAD